MQIRCFPILGFLSTFRMVFWGPYRNSLWQKKFCYNLFQVKPYFAWTNRVVAAGSEIDKVTSAENAFAIFIAKHNLPMAVGDEFGLLAKVWCTTVPVAPPGGEKILTTAFSRFFVRSVPLFRSLMLTPMMCIVIISNIQQ